MARLRQAVAESWHAGWRFYLRFNPILEPLRARPDFRELLDGVETDMGERRESRRATIDAVKRSVSSSLVRARTRPMAFPG